ncbi:hypothetical protein D0859_05773 [Hortaea werneckii]|uniref:Uncharacterized protein n=1 Tax=Hortaea werneckii TaxID=91943 RepID=A0A3M7IXN5_HORWE|nr:hypothetical protein D0859_05773 [Hortaea werneckii]
MDLDNRPPKLVDIEFDFRHILLGSVDNLVKILADLAKRCRRPADKKPDLSGRWSADIISPYAWKELREQVGAVNATTFATFSRRSTWHSTAKLISPLNDEEHSAASLSSSQLLVFMRSDVSCPEKDDSNSEMIFAWAALSVNKPGGNKAQFMQWFQLMSMTQLSDLQTQLAHVFSRGGMHDSPTPFTLDWDWKAYAAALRRSTDGGKPRYEDSDVIAHFEGAVLPRMLHIIRRAD